MSSLSASPPPKLSPKQPLSRRAPLLERTKSQANEIANLSLRLVEDDDRAVYSRTPYPSKPAHILSPPKGQGFVFDEENHVSNHASPSNKPIPSLEHVEDHKDNSRRLGDGSQISPVTRIDESPPSFPGLPAQRSQSSLPAATGQLQDVLEESDASSGRPSDEVIVLPDIHHLENSIRTVDETPDNSPNPSSRLQELSSSPNFVTINTSSSSSLTSSNSHGTVRRYSDRGGHWTLATFPLGERPTSSTSDLSYLRTLNTVPETLTHDSPPPNSSSEAYSSRPPSSVVASSSPNFTVHYPVVRPPSSSSGSWAESSLAIPKRNPRMTDRDSPKWNPHLSTVPSEWSQEKRQERPEGYRSYPSGMNIEEPSSSSTPQPPQPLFFGQNRDGLGSTSVDEAEMAEGADSVTDLRSRPLRTKNSGFLSLWSSDSRTPSLASIQERPGSSRSNRSHMIPAWARAYYSRGGTDSLITISRESSLRQEGASPVADYLPLSVFRSRPLRSPQARNRPLPERPESSFVEGSVHEAQQVPIVRQPPRSYVRRQWSPHLLHAPRSEHPWRSVWKAPSLDEKAEGIFSRRNVQVGLFAAGFLFPLAWLVGSFLPLPPQPSDVENAEAARPLTHFDHQAAAIDEVRYENARWWRIMNRSMSVVGVVILATVITLAVVVTR